MLVLRMLALAYYEWALREIDPMHPDVVKVMGKITDLRDSIKTF